MPRKQHSPANRRRERLTPDDRVSARRYVATRPGRGAAPLRRCTAEPGPMKATTTMLARWTPAQQRTTPQERRAAQHPGNDTGRRLPQLGRCVLLVLAVLHQIVDHGGIRQRRGVAEASRFVLGDLAQDAAHDLAGTGFW